MEIIEKDLNMNSCCWRKYINIGTLKILVDKRLGMIIIISKDSNILQVSITTMNKGVGQVNIRKGRY